MEGSGREDSVWARLNSFMPSLLLPPTLSLNCISYPGCSSVGLSSYNERKPQKVVYLCEVGALTPTDSDRAFSSYMSSGSPYIVRHVAMGVETKGL